VKYENILKRSLNFSRIEERIAPVHRRIENVVLHNQHRVLKAFQDMNVDETCFFDSTGYGYNDRGRETLDALYAAVFGGEAALVRPQFVSGTHAIACCLYGILNHGERLVSLTGRPYDTLQKALGLSGDTREKLPGGINYTEVDFCNGIDHTDMDNALAEGAHMVFIQRSRGYAERRSLTVNDIAELVGAVKNRLPAAVILVDNCYGEFVQDIEPCHVGADMVAGSLIKNPGAGLAPTGGYVAGRADLVEKAAWRLTAPGLGAGVGSMAGVKRLFYQGIFLAPHQVGESLKGMTLASALFAEHGFEVSPAWDEDRGDTVQAVKLGNPQLLKRFCRAAQAASPVDSRVLPQPAPMAGYSDKIIMAAGTFVQGASSEFSADAPLRPPYTAYLQGGLTYAHIKLALAAVLEELGLSADRCVLDSAP
jgi:cystathionine beta-lyase family protein involved in aluminum resistance